MEDHILLIIAIVGVIAMPIIFLLAKEKAIKSVSVEELEKKLKSSRSFTIIGFMALLIYCLLCIFNKLNFSVPLLIQILFGTYMCVFILLTNRSIMKEKKKRQNEEAIEHKPVRMKKKSKWIISLIAIAISLVIYFIFTGNIFSIKDHIRVFVTVLVIILITFLIYKILDKIPLKTKSKKLTDNNQTETE